MPKAKRVTPSNADRWAIQLHQTRSLPRPIPASGGQGLRRVPAAIQQQMLEQLQEQTAVSDVTNAPALQGFQAFHLPNARES